MKIELEHVENQSLEIEKIVREVVDKYTDDLDEYMLKIKNVLESGTDELTSEDMNRILIRLTSYSYFLGTKLEIAGIRADVSEAVRVEKYNSSYLTANNGTVAFKQSLAEEASKEEAVVALVYSRVYKVLKAKCGACEKLADAIKKVISVRIAEMGLGTKV
jgi:hypothetical protein